MARTERLIKQGKIDILTGIEFEINRLATADAAGYIRRVIERLKSEL